MEWNQTKPCKRTVTNTLFMLKLAWFKYRMDGFRDLGANVGPAVPKNIKFNCSDSIFLSSKVRFSKTSSKMISPCKCTVTNTIIKRNCEWGCLVLSDLRDLGAKVGPGVLWKHPS